ncbi:MAG: MFS transporter [Cytophagales bacterium]|nr:MAG: MFS transporter [Cytophagales bacterium]
MIDATNSVEKHPAALYWLFFTEMWERFSYYGMRALLILYLTTQLVKGGLGWSDDDAGQMYGIYTAASYIITILGGYLADKLLGSRRSVFIGGILMALAQFTLSAGSGMQNTALFFVGLFLLVIGNGFFKPNISSMVGQFYPDGSRLKDSAYTIFYMGINIGAFIGSLICGGLGEVYGWQYGFGAAGVGMVLGLVIFYFAQPALGNVGLAPKAQAELDTNVETKTPLTAVEMQRLAVAFILSFFSIVFWGSFEQAGSTMNIFAARYTDRNLGGFEVPATWFQSVNAFFIFTLAPLFSLLWVALDKRNINPNGAVKFAIGLLLVGLGFGFLVLGSGDIEKGATSASVSMTWLVLAYLFHTMGELCLSPVGLSFINKLSPVRLAGFMFGIWFLASGLGNYFGGAVYSIIGGTKNYSYSEFFSFMLVVPVSAGLLLLLISPLLKKWMHGVK